MATIAVVGAGPGLGLSIARTFGRQGFDVALISRNQDRLAGLVETLRAAGIGAEAFAADVADRAALTGALTAAADQFGTIDVLEFSPMSGLHMCAPEEVTVENMAPQMEEVLYGAITATQAVLPAMLERGAGSLLYTTGGGAIEPYPFLATVNAAQAALRNWARNLHNTLGSRGVYVGHVAINTAISDTSPGDGIPYAAPDVIAAQHWELHEQRNRFDSVVNG